MIESQWRLLRMPHYFACLNQALLSSYQFKESGFLSLCPVLYFERDTIEE